MTAKDVERLLAKLTGFSAARLDQTTRALRAAAVLPQSQRGRGARQLSVSDVAFYLIAVAASDQPARAAEAVRCYAPMPGQDGDSRGEPFAAAIGRALSDLTLASDIGTVLVCRSWPMATISRLSGTEVRFLPQTASNSASESLAGLGLSPYPSAGSLLSGNFAVADEAPVFCALRTPLITAFAQRLAAAEHRAPPSPRAAHRDR
ncbi:MAG: hypothetical protein HC826_00580 [Rhodospirillales bacterium]|nr:hypothetical protein [Rhodospirillales bacterium]